MVNENGRVNQKYSYLRRSYVHVMEERSTGRTHSFGKALFPEWKFWHQGFGRRLHVTDLNFSRCHENAK